MPRKYAGPLRPGEKSAYVKGTRRQAYRKRRAVPGRIKSSKSNLKTYKETRRIAKVIQSMSETKIKELTKKNAIVPKPVEVGATNGPCYFTNYCLGTAPAAWTGPNGAAAFNDLDGFVWAQGTGADQRVGQYMYLKRTTLNLRVAMDTSSRSGSTKFRVIVYKERRNRYNTTANGNPCDDLFIAQNGEAVGVNTAAPVDQRAMDFNTWLVNKRNYIVVKDFKFILAPETISASGFTEPFNVNQVHKAEKCIRLSLGHYQKAKFGAANVPEDQMYRYCVTIISMPTSTNAIGHNSYKTYVNGVVSAVDN